VFLLPPPVQVCECLILFMERNEDEFAKFLQTFTQDVWTQLMKVSQAPGQVGEGCSGVGLGVGREAAVIFLSILMIQLYERSPPQPLISLPSSVVLTCRTTWPCTPSTS
jgi:hypothetical protein